MEKFKNLLKTKEYGFLKNNEHLKDNIIMLTLGGSHAYGTNNENSDFDLRGCALERVSDLIGFTEFEQFIETETDTTIYSFNKLIKLLSNCNPNVIEMLGCKPEHYLYLSKEGRELLNNKRLFLSQRCVTSFGGYALQQLNRLNNALARDRLGQSEKEKHILNSIKSAMLTFDTRYTKFENNEIILNIRESQKEDLESEIFLDINLRDFPLRDFGGILSEMQSILKSYGKLNHRNKKKDNNHLDKHAMHLVRLYLMVIDLLEREEIVTYREDDLELLMSIREGGFRKADGTYDSNFFELVEELRKRADYAAKGTSLPVQPDMKKIEEFTMDINKNIILKEI